MNRWSQIENRYINSSKWKSRLIVCLPWKWTLYKHETRCTIMSEKWSMIQLKTNHNFLNIFLFLYNSADQLTIEKHLLTEDTLKKFVVYSNWLLFLHFDLQRTLTNACVTKRHWAPASSSALVCTSCDDIIGSRTYSLALSLPLSLFFCFFLLSWNTDHQPHRSFGFQMRCVIN